MSINKYQPLRSDLGVVLCYFPKKENSKPTYVKALLENHPFFSFTPNIENAHLFTSAHEIKNWINYVHTKSRSRSIKKKIERRIEKRLKKHERDNFESDPEIKPNSFYTKSEEQNLRSTLGTSWEIRKSRVS